VAKNPMISSVCPEDFGLKAAFLKDKNSPVTFKPIVGWVSIGNYSEINSRSMAPLVLDDMSYPTMASRSSFPDFIGVVSKSTNASDAKKQHQNVGALE